MSNAPVSAADCFHRGVALLGQNRLAEAEQAFHAALERVPNLVEAHLNLGWIMSRTGRRAEAEAAYRRACALDPLRMQTHLNLATLMLEQKRFADAEYYSRHACAIDPRAPSALSSLGLLLAYTRREQEAEACYRAALAADPAHAKARFNLAYLLLRQGHYEEGWQCMEAREISPHLQVAFGFPRWQGEALQGKSVLIACEAGYGDMIQFSRYAELLGERGAARVGILCYPPLKELFAGLRGVHEVVGLDAALPLAGWDCWTLPLSLPFLFGTRLDTVPARLPYLHAEPARSAYWADALGDGRALRVGLVWKGNPAHDNDRDRSLPSLAALAPLAEVPDLRFFSLQKGGGEDEAAPGAQPFAIEDLAPRIHDFGDTAAIVANLDLVVTVDTAVAHLAGALGKPCWVLLPYYMTDWRWMTARADTPWYPHVMRLFRQKTDGDWAPALAELKAALAAWRAESVAR